MRDKMRHKSRFNALLLSFKNYLSNANLNLNDKLSLDYYQLLKHLHHHLNNHLDIYINYYHYHILLLLKLNLANSTNFLTKMDIYLDQLIL